METPLPYMEEMEDALIHIDIKDGGYGDSLSPDASLRLRTFWLLARLFYEVRFYPLAKMAQLKPFNAVWHWRPEGALHHPRSSSLLHQTNLRPGSRYFLSPLKYVGSLRR
ncbi:hypothetical protein SAMN05216573_102167 [Bradyrhizobium sp. Rc3b]|nr:hypothetical protein SAMN05216573_102167 [Bradyrhizobium sp. Rc3b]